MKSGVIRAVLYGALILAYLLHNDLWLWHDAGVVLGLPVGLTYHVAYCLVVAVLMAVLIRFAWPFPVEEQEHSSDS